MSTDSNRNPGDQEIDLNTISRGIGKGIDSISSFIFGCIQFFLRNIIIVVVLLVVGIGLGIYLDRTQKVYDNQMIVTPNFGSTDYLYSRIDLLNAKIRQNDTVFLHNLGIKKPSILLEIKVKPIVDIYKFINNNELNYKMVELMAEDGDINKILEQNTTSKNYASHEILLTTNAKISEQDIVAPIFKFLNDNLYFDKVRTQYNTNVLSLMKSNDVTLSQINAILNQYGQASASGINDGKNGNLIYNSDSQLNDIIKSKDELLKAQSDYLINMVGLDQTIKENSSILNIQNVKSTNGKMKLILPLLFIFLFILTFLIKSFYKTQALKHKAIN